MSETTTGPRAGAPAADELPSIDFSMELAVALQTYGVPANRLEESLVALSRRLGLAGQFFSTPTSIMAAFVVGGRHHNRLARVHRWGLDLGRMAELDAVATAVADGRWTVSQGRDAIHRIALRAPAYGRVLPIVAFGLASAAGARFFAGGPWDAVAAGVVGAAMGVWAELAGRSEAVERLQESIAAFLATLLAGVAAWWMPSVSAPVVTIAGLVGLFPGLAFTSAMTELATRNLASGTARLAGALVTFMGLALGVAAGARVAEAVLPPMPSVAVEAMPSWTEWPAVAAASLGFAVLLRLPGRDIPASMAAGAAGYVGTTWGGSLLGPDVGSALGALAVGVVANLYSRWTLRPALVVLVPGILLLVPGSVGFRSVSSMLEQDAVSGLELAFTMTLVAASLVAGLLASNAVVSPRRPL